jgi:hypothetical protein
MATGGHYGEPAVAMTLVLRGAGTIERARGSIGVRGRLAD